MIKEPDKVPVYHADAGVSLQVHHLLSIVANTRDLPKLKPLHDEAMAELEVLAEEGRVRLLKFGEATKAREAEIVRLKAEEQARINVEEARRVAAAQKASSEAEARSLAQSQAAPQRETDEQRDRRIEAMRRATPEPARVG